MLNQNEDSKSDRILSSPFKIGAHNLANRIVMSPISCLSLREDTSNLSTVDYYAMRASAGLIVTEPTLISPMKEFHACPGIYSHQQVQQWRKITEAVHQRGGKIFLQLWCGEKPQISFLHQEHSIKRTGKPNHRYKLSTVQESSQEAQITNKLFRRAAQNALAADFDGVEIQIAFAYLINRPAVDKIDLDRYLLQQTEYLLSIVEEVCSVWDENRVGIRIPPKADFDGIEFLKLLDEFYILLDALNFYDLAYIHLVESFPSNSADRQRFTLVLSLFRSIYRGAIISSFTGCWHEAKAAIMNNYVDLISFNRLTID